MNAIKQHMTGLAILSAQISAMVALLIGGLVFAVWFTIQALTYIV